MGRLTDAERQTLRQEKEFKEKVCQTKPMQEGEGEEFLCNVKRASNGYILEGKGQVLVFREIRTVLDWILERRLVEMKTGEEIEITLTQRFIKLLPNDTDKKDA